MSETAHILVVDDEQRAVEMLVRTLRKMGSVDTAATGDEAWELFERGSYDLVISDQRMPGMSGVDLLGRAALRDESVGRILLTGYSDLEATVEAINRGRVHAYLHKPCSPDDLRMVAGGVLERVRLVRENDRLIEALSERNHDLQQALADLAGAQHKVISSERLAAIGQMIASIVHDLRGPLSGVRSAGAEIVSWAESASAPTEISGLGDEVLAGCDQMERMCSGLLEVSQVSGRRPDRSEELMDEVVATAMASMAQDASHQGVTMDLALGSGARVSLDEDLIRRALWNLVRNAVEAMPAGGRLRIETRCEDGSVWLSVIDDGVGIPDEIRENLFDAFVTSGKPGGTGLGLSVVQKVVEDHEGSIRVSKPEGGGTAFEIRLPVAAQDLA